MLTTAAQYEETVRAVAKTLLVEAGYSLQHLRRSDSSDLRRIIQHLLVVRPAPDEVDTQEEILYQQMDQVLALEQTRVSLVDAAQLPTVSGDNNTMDVWRQIALWKGDITSLRATAIVNAANAAMLGCFQPPHRCIDNVIHCKAGPRLRTACAEIMETQRHEEPVGSAKITPGFALPSTYVVHTVGPQLRRGQKPTPNERAQLQSCYTTSLDILLETVQKQTKKENENNDATSSSGAVTIAFPCISTGLFAFPSDEAVPLAVNAVRDWLITHANETASWKVIFNTFLQTDFDLYKAHFESHVPGLELPAPGPDPSVEAAAKLIQDADYLLISAGAGLSAAAGLDYTSEEVMQKFHPNVRNVLPSFRTMYSSIGFSDWPPELMWGYLFKQISIARFDWVRHRTAPTYSNLLAIRQYIEATRGPQSTYVATSNADGMFEQEGFPRETTCLMQGEYGRIQCKRPCRPDSIWDARPFMEKALESFKPESYEIEDPEGIPQCPHCEGPMFLLLRIDRSFMESALADGKRAYRQWLSNVMYDVRHNNKTLAILEIGVGFNTPGVLRIPNEELATTPGVNLIRINNDHPELPFDSHGLGLGVDANQALQFMADTLTTKPTPP